ncbi:PREDICTED: geranylgeranyl transferase type-2 subunit alpha-like [Acropora digitifera]|uniref:geranylgeranyl transferase type-2 subunit alpha-like n=1 Tax=Acropora digitifera TaxID=70779 RepID=UPI00077AF429|nr:PREDICTED: geranylgeranyl transferase type-2 subunit alpha-like [Acropora digitifera]
MSPLIEKSCIPHAGSHGRVKVRTTAEQAEAKRKEREKKLKIYSETTNRIHEKRKNGDMDKESLSLSEQVLSANPDYLTLWNFRREIFLHMKEEK